MRKQPVSSQVQVEDASMTLVESAYWQIRRHVIEGVLLPGEQLRVEHVKDKYGVGAGTLREALTLLVADALVVAEGRKGFRVAPISVEDLEDVTENRVRLETEALRQSIQHGNDVWESNVVAAFHRLSLVEQAPDKRGGVADVDAYEERNRIFHETLLAACPSHWLLYFTSILYCQSERYRRLALAKSPLRRNVHAEHTALVKAALNRDADKACALLTDHIRVMSEAIRLLPGKLFGKQPSRAPGGGAKKATGKERETVRKAR
jgi:DNA-binding GntR family transcriptional regulator